MVRQREARPAMKLLDRHEFTNERAFEVYLLEADDLAERELPECDVIGLRRVNGGGSRMTTMRPDEALIMARLLIEAVRKVTAEYKVEAGE